jgi:LuxR family maltose regulon positive regulatory protein
MAELSVHPHDPRALLVTKLQAPRARPDLLHRPHLADALDRAIERDVVLVSTPAGFGKTTLLAAWARGTSRPTAWLSLEPGDDDPARFWSHVDAAVDRAHADSRLADLLARPDRPPTDVIVATLVQRLADVPGGLVLILDDLHVIGSDRVHEGLGRLLAHLPEGVHVVMASRSDPPLPLARLRARGQLAELRTTDLRFDRDEMAAFLAGGYGLELSDPVSAALFARTEGWAAGLQLAALWLRDHPDPEGAVEAFSGSHSFVLDYLTDEVLDRQPAAVREFLLDTSVLSALTASLCYAVTGRPDSQRLLEGLERDNLFLVPLDGERRWYRYHHLFASLLRFRAGQIQPTRVTELHRRAADWCEHHLHVSEAVRHALAGGDSDRADRLVVGHVSGLLAAGEATTVQHWQAERSVTLAAHPTEAAAVDAPAPAAPTPPRLLLVQAVAALLAGHLGEGERLIDRAEEQAADVHAEADDDTRREALVVRAELAKMRGDADGMEHFAGRALAVAADGSDPDPGVDFYARSNRAYAALLRGEAHAAEAAFHEFVAQQQAAGHVHHALRSSYHLARALIAQGRLRDADAACRVGLQVAATLAGPDEPAAGIAHLGLAEVLTERGQLDEARDHAETAAEQCAQLGYFRWTVAGAAALARVRRLAGDLDGAADVLAQAERGAPHHETMTADVINPIPIERASLRLAHGDLDAVARCLAARAVTEHDRPAYGREREHLLLATVLLARRQPDRALALLVRLGAHAQAQGRTGSVVHVRALQAVALQAAGQPTDALRTIGEALALARPHGHVRAFVDAGPTVAPLLRRLVASQHRGRATVIGADAVHEASRVLRVLHPSRPPRAAGPDGGVGLVQQLTERELEVLALLAIGRRNRDIANELVVSLETVKKHITHILTKLAVTNRTEAVAHARALDLIG